MIKLRTCQYGFGVIILEHIKLQAHRGVACECPENTMSAFRCAIMQGYDVIEIDLDYTKDRKIVALHDNYINRAARKNDGSIPESAININDITYADVLKYDFGASFSLKFRGEKIPLFEDVLKIAKKAGVRLKIDNKMQNFPTDVLDNFFSIIKDFEQFVSVTSNNIDFVKICLNKNNKIAIDYDGNVSEDVLNELSAYVPKEKLTVWFPYKCENTYWAKVPFADEKKCVLVKKYAKLGIWIINDYESFCDVTEKFSPDIVETDGTIKPIKNVNARFDMHTHSRSSHDSVCEVSDMQSAMHKKGLTGFAVTDHCDIEYYETQNLDEIFLQSVTDAIEADKNGKTRVLCGIEIGEGFWHPGETNRIIRKFNFDVIIGSVHAVKFNNYYMPYSKIDFSKMGYEVASEYFDSYFDDMLYMIDHCDIDILAHLTCPLRYINGKYGLNIEPDRYMDKIERILKIIIERKIALEVNTSCVCDGSGYCEFMPNVDIIKMYRDMGGYLITTGSDAHIAQNAANKFDTLYKTLKELGFKNTYYFKNRCAIQCTIK